MIGSGANAASSMKTWEKKSGSILARVRQPETEIVEIITLKLHIHVNGGKRIRSPLSLEIMLEIGLMSSLIRPKSKVLAYSLKI